MVSERTFRYGRKRREFYLGYMTDGRNHGCVVYLPDGTVLENSVWTLRNPFPEQGRLKDLLSFYVPGPNFRLVVDGEEVKL